jgi:hypothetical protein
MRRIITGTSDAAVARRRWISSSVPRGSNFSGSTIVAPMAIWIVSVSSPNEWNSGAGQTMTSSARYGTTARTWRNATVARAFALRDAALGLPVVPLVWIRIRCDPRAPNGNNCPSGCSAMRDS